MFPFAVAIVKVTKKGARVKQLTPMTWTPAEKRLTAKPTGYFCQLHAERKSLALKFAENCTICLKNPS